MAINTTSFTPLNISNFLPSDMDTDLQISLDNLPIKRLDAIEENGIEKFPPDVGHDQKQVDLIRRIDFAWALEKDEKKKKQKKANETTPTWEWQSLVENLQSAHQELSVIIDVINTVEANDAVTVAGMTRPKQLPNEALADVSVSAATKLQCFRHVGRYFKQSAKALERQVAREARFYGALIRLQQNWKIKRQRMAASALASDGFTIDLFDSSLSDPTAGFRPPSISTVRVEHDSAGMLAVHLPPKSCRSIQFGFLHWNIEYKPPPPDKTNMNGSAECPRGEPKQDVSKDEDVDGCVKGTHSVLRGVHRSIFDEQVFESVNREAFNPTIGVNVTGIRENYLELGIGQGAAVYLSLAPSEEDADQLLDSTGDQNMEAAVSPFDTFEGVEGGEQKPNNVDYLSRFPSPVNCEIYLQQIFHENVFVRTKNRCPSAGRTQILSGHPSGDRVDILGHFCKTLAHRIFSSKVLAQLENLTRRVPYLHLLTHPTWHSRTSSWLLSMKVPQSILHAGSQIRPSNIYRKTNGVRSQFHTRVVVIDDCINVEGESAPDVVGLFKGGSEDICSMNSYDCDLADLPMILLLQAASQVICWLHEEALMVGLKATRDFLSLFIELQQGDILCLVAHVDPLNTEGCISWWSVIANGMMEEGKLNADFSNGDSGNTRFLGYLSLETLHSVLMDLVSWSACAMTV